MLSWSPWGSAGLNQRVSSLPTDYVSAFLVHYYRTMAKKHTDSKKVAVEQPAQGGAEGGAAAAEEVDDGLDENIDDDGLGDGSGSVGGGAVAAEKTGGELKAEVVGV